MVDGIEAETFSGARISPAALIARIGDQSAARMVDPMTIAKPRWANRVQSHAERADTQFVTQLIETRWTRYGKDRVYLKTADGDDVGHVDLVARIVVAKAPDYETELHECLIRWTSAPEAATQEAETAASISSPPTEPAAETQPSEPVDFEPPVTNDDIYDLAANVAGAAARARRNELNAQASMLNFVARVLGAKTDERAWRVGAKGEEKVARELAKLGPAWRVLHAIEVGSNGSDLDHIVIGPPGVITLNAKRHPRGKAWVGERMVMVNGQKTNYLRNSRFEAQRAARLLSAACGRPMAAVAAVVFVDLDDFTVKQMSVDVHVTTRRRLGSGCSPCRLRSTKVRSTRSSPWPDSATPGRRPIRVSYPNCRPFCTSDLSPVAAR